MSYENVRLLITAGVIVLAFTAANYFTRKAR